MSLEELTKTQIILLTLLVSFVTSIATGIVTVSLVEQAPPGFTQTVNRVVERTVEKVVPTQVAGGNTVTKETTVVVKEEDLITQSIGKVNSSIVAIRQAAVAEDGTPTETFVGWGTILSDDGLVVTDSSLLNDGASYTLETADKKQWKASIAYQDDTQGVGFLKIEKSATDTTKFTGAKLAQSSSLRLGQTAIAFGGFSKQAVAIGIISSFNEVSAPKDGTATSTTTPTIKKITGIEISSNPTSGATGGPFINIFGEVAGMRIAEGEGKLGYVSSDVIQEVRAALSVPAKK